MDVAKDTQALINDIAHSRAIELQGYVFDPTLRFQLTSIGLSLPVPSLWRSVDDVELEDTLRNSLTHVELGDYVREARLYLRFVHAIGRADAADVIDWGYMAREDHPEAIQPTLRIFIDAPNEDRMQHIIEVANRVISTEFPSVNRVVYHEKTGLPRLDSADVIS